MDWLDYFIVNKKNRLPIDWVSGIRVEPHLREPLIRSLQKFQVGESGEGRHLKAGAFKTGDTRYTRAVDLFIAEEKDHSHILKNAILGMGGSLLNSHWSDTAFILLRRLIGLKLELMVLLIAEMIAKRYYRALDEGTRDPLLSAAFGQIRRDEEGHITFHLEYLNNTFGRWPWLGRALVYTTWLWMFRIISILVALDHRDVLAATGVKPLNFWHDCQSIFENAAWYALRPASKAVNSLIFPALDRGAAVDEISA